MQTFSPASWLLTTYRVRLEGAALDSVPEYGC
jgi:hypothetical protein